MSSGFSDDGHRDAFAMFLVLYTLSDEVASLKGSGENFVGTAWERLLPPQ